MSGGNCPGGNCPGGNCPRTIVQKQSISAIAEPSPCPFNPSNHLKNLKGFIFCLSTASSESTFTLFGMWKRTFQVIPHLEFIQWWHIFHTLSRQSLCILTFYDTTGKKWKTPLYVKMMRKWRNFNWEKKENSIPLCRILMV